MKDRPTCILFPDDMALIGGLNVIRAKGLKIPKDISIAGYDGSRLSQMLSPKHNHKTGYRSNRKGS